MTIDQSEVKKSRPLTKSTSHGGEAFSWGDWGLLLILFIFFSFDFLLFLLIFWNFCLRLFQPQCPNPKKSKKSKKEHPKGSGLARTLVWIFGFFWIWHWGWRIQKFKKNHKKPKRNTPRALAWLVRWLGFFCFWIFWHRWFFWCWQGDADRQCAVGGNRLKQTNQMSRKSVQIRTLRLPYSIYFLKNR